MRGGVHADCMLEPRRLMMVVPATPLPCSTQEYQSSHRLTSSAQTIGLKFSSEKNGAAVP